MYPFLLFDLDGTLTDPGLGITNSVAYALRKFGIDVQDRTRLYPFIGPPLLDAFQSFYAFTPEQSRQALTFYREYFSDRGIFENEVYPQIPELLSTLKAQDKKLILATSKPEPFANRILTHFDLASYFDFVAGATMDEKRNTKPDVIAYAMQECGIDDPKQAVMIGDREHDVLGAKANHMASIGVLYGYGNREELEKAGADAVAASPMDILRFV